MQRTLGESKCIAKFIEGDEKRKKRKYVYASSRLHVHARKEEEEEGEEEKEEEENRHHISKMIINIENPRLVARLLHTTHLVVH